MTRRLGIDAGTTNVKAALTDEAGGLVGATSCAFEVRQPRQGWHEIHPDSWWQAVVFAVSQVMAETGTDPRDVASIGISGIGCTPCALDSTGAVLAHAPTWADSRAEAETAAHSAFAAEVLAGSGSPLGSWSFVPKLWWWQANHPRLFERIAHVVEPAGFIVYRMTGVLAQDVHTGPLNYAFDLASETWNTDLAKRLSIPPEILPPIVSPLQPAGDGLSAAAAEQLGLRPGTRVVNCGGDPVPVSLAVGVYQAGQAFLHTGTGSNIGILNAEKLVHPAYLTQLHILPGMSYLSGLMSATGASMLWARDKLLGETVTAARQLGDELTDFEIMSALAQHSDPGSNGVVYLPYLFGRQSPTWDAEVRATLLGLSSETTRGDLVRAVMEGVAFEVAANLPIAAEFGAPVEEIRAGGGPNKSEIWNQIYADVTGVPLITTVTDGDAAIGCSWMSGVADGSYSLATCASEFATVKRVYEPDPPVHERYREIGGALEDLYPALRAYYGAASAAASL